MKYTSSDIIDSGLQLVEQGVLVKMKASGMSMFPFLRKNDMLIIRKCQLSALDSGDVIVFKTRRGIIAHRIIRVRKKGNPVLITKGDSSYNFDEPVTEDNYIGKVVAYERNGRKRSLNGKWKKIQGKMVVILTPLLPLLYKFARKLRRTS